MVDTPERPLLVTGATGFIGGHLALRLLRDGQPLRLLVRDPQRLHPELRAHAQVIRGDLADTASLAESVRGVRTVLHCAANVATWGAWPEYVAANVDGVRKLAQAMQRDAAGARLVHLSSVDVYGFPREPADETRPADGGSFGYGRSKALGEAVLREHARELDVVVLRPCNVVGPRSPFVRRVGDELRGGLMLKVDGGRADFGHLDVDNLIDVMLWAAHAPQAAGHTFNVRDPVAVNWAGFIDELRRGIGGRGVVLNLPFALADVAAAALEAPHRLLRLRGEPLLHRLIVRIFGRSCGHSIDALRAAGAPLGRVGHAESMRRAIAWYLDEGLT
ncbi:UDP-glucose 4-epimerase [mine drainage metagenome]|jgi:nucleoside-diphosphate-sugar epimerase|uniref:UDP-glucose 4-epimerase n=1 Tax=mine drainage metagenome TaxID=410659 RepID=A0A1J5QIT0_9ZZZZ